METPVHLALLPFGVTAAVALAYLIRARRMSPEERERNRRLAVNSRGRLIEGVVTEIRDGAVFYAYSWRGIDYDCSQDISTISALMPREAQSLAGPVTVEFIAKDPYNSIVLCESWSGFPQPKNKLNLVKESQ